MSGFGRGNLIHNYCLLLPRFAADVNIDYTLTQRARAHTDRRAMASVSGRVLLLLSRLLTPQMMLILNRVAARAYKSL